MAAAWTLALAMLGPGLLPTRPAYGQQGEKSDGGRHGTLTIQSQPAGAKVFIRTGGHNGFAEVGKTPITLKDLAPGLLEYTLLAPDHRPCDGSLWIEPSGNHVETTTLTPGRLIFVSEKAPRDGDGLEASPFVTINRAVQQTKPGDTVLVREGEYHESTQGEYKSRGAADEDGVWIEGKARGGLPGQPVVYRAYPGERVRVTAKNRVFILKACELVVDGSIFEPLDFLTGDSPIWLGGQHCLVQNCEVIGHDVPVNANHAGVGSWYGTRESVVRNCLIRGVKGGNGCG